MQSDMHTESLVCLALRKLGKDLPEYITMLPNIIVFFSECLQENEHETPRCNNVYISKASRFIFLRAAAVSKLVPDAIERVLQKEA